MAHLPEPCPTQRCLAQPTTKIRTIRGPEPTKFTSNVVFALASAMRVVYHQQTKNLLGRTRTAPRRSTVPLPTASDKTRFGLPARSLTTKRLGADQPQMSDFNGA